MDKTSYSISYTLTYPNPAQQANSGVIIIGTAHVSDRSIAEVREALERERPSIVAVELDVARYNALKGKPEVKELPLKEILGQGRFYYFLLHWLLAYVQRKIGSEIGIKPGAEMLAAIDKAEEIGAKVALVDRDIQITFQRFWSKMSFFEKARLFLSLLLASLGLGVKEIDIDRITEEDAVTQLLNELRQFSPGAARVLIDERDAYIAGNLLMLAREGKVVAVVGAGHRAGIQNLLDNPDKIPPLESLVTLPKKSLSLMKIGSAAILLMFLSLFLLFAISGIPISTLLTALLYLFVTQGILSALGVLIARGHPFSAATAFGLAWFGFLHPFLAIGWLAGLVEAYLRPPSTQDFKTIMEAESFSQLMGNRLFRVVLVAGLANLGSMIGTFIAIPIMVHYLNIPDPLGIFKQAISNGISIIKAF